MSKTKITFNYLAKRMLSLPPVLGLIIGLTINCLSIPIPSILFNVLDTLAKANKPLVLLLMGIYLSFELDKSQFFAISKVLVLRLIFGFLIVCSLFYLLPAYPQIRNVLMICCLLPIGMTILPFSDELNYDSRIAGTLLNFSLILSFVCMWALVIGLGL
jgi:predicted permease